MESELTMTKKPTQYNTADMQKIEPTGLGERLKTAREAMRLTEKEAGARLHLSPKIICVMENEDFENGPPATFIRGYLRSYARMLNISESEINAAVANLESTIPQTPQPSAPPILKTSPRNQTHHYLRLMTFGVVAILMVLVSVWWTSHPKDLITYVKATTSTLAPVVATNNVHALAPVAQTAPTAPVANTQAQAPTAQTQPVAPAVQATTTPAVTAPATPSTKETKTDAASIASADTDEETPAATETKPTPTAKNTTADSTTAPTSEESTTNLADMGMAHPEPGLDLNDTDNNNNSTGEENNNTAN